MFNIVQSKVIIIFKVIRNCICKSIYHYSLYMYRNVRYLYMQKIQYSEVEN